MKKQSVFIIDDDAPMRENLLMLLRTEDVEVRAFAGAAEFFDTLPEDRAACVITDVAAPLSRGLDLVRQVQSLRGACWPVIVMTGQADVAMAVALMKAGVSDLIEKPFDPVRMMEAVRACLASLKGREAEHEMREQVRGRLALLTPREHQVFDALILGRSNKEMALQLDISPRTVEIFRAKVMHKMQADSLSALVHMGLRAGDA